MATNSPLLMTDMPTRKLENLQGGMSNEEDMSKLLTD
ncbi:unnamed protein product [Rhodiola kirilowii]